MIDPHPDHALRRDISRRTMLTIGAGTSVGVALGLAAGAAPASASTTGTTYYVAKNGSDTAAGTSTAPLLTIKAAAQKAQPGDVVLVRSGIYREEVVLPRGGTSDSARITYAADAGAAVTITGSDLFTTWTQVSGDVWQVKIPNSYFNGFNPYAEQVHGDWFSSNGRIHRPGMVYLNGAWLPQATSLAAVSSNAGPSWWSVVDGHVEGTAPKYIPSYSATGYTTITARFPGVNPNQGAAEVCIRGSVFRPAETNYDYVTIRGFNLRNAATNWAAPTMGQGGLVSAYWCKGWVIEDNEIAYSRCSGIALGKYSDQYDGLRGTTEGYYLTISDAQTTGGWSFANIGSHVVRNNHIHHCGQTAIVGSLGAIGSVITGNEIYHINTQGIWGGAEMAGIKLHGAIDVTISGNHIYNTGQWGGIWLDWMAQGTRVIGNLMHDNAAGDLFPEVSHGPLLIANNILLSPKALWCLSEGIAWAHNLVTGALTGQADGRQTPYMQPHSTATVANADIQVGNQQWVNNILGSGANLTLWDGASASYPISMKANVYTKGAVKSAKEQGGIDASTVSYAASLWKAANGWFLTVPRVEAWRTGQALVTTSSLAKAPTPNQAFTNPDGSAMSVSTDFLGAQRSSITPFPGPFEIAGGAAAIKVWSRVVPTTDAWGRTPSPNPSGPGAATDANGKITVHVRGTDNQLHQRAFDGTSWTSWTALGGPNAGTFAGAPAVCATVGRTDVFVRGTDNACWQRTWTSAGGWTAWTSLGGVLTDNPAAANDSSGHLIVHVRGTDNQIWQRTFNGTSWTNWTAFGGPNAGTFTGAPALCATGTRQDVFVRGTDNQLWQRTWSPAGWGAWTPLGGVLVDSPAAATAPNGNISVYVRGTDNGLHQRTFNGTTWTSWTALGEPNGSTFAGAPAVTATNGRTDVFVRGTDNALWQVTWTPSGGWTTWTSHGGVLG